MTGKRLLVPLLATAALATGCQTDRRGVEVNLTAVLQTYRERLDRRPTRAEVERVVAALPAAQLNDLGVLYEREGNLDRAAWAYQRAIWRDPRLARAYVNLGNVLRKQGKLEEARFRYRQAIAAEPGNFEAVNNFADLCAETGRGVEQAVALLRPLLDQAGALRPYGLDTLGWLYHAQGDDLRAAEVLEEGLRAASDGGPELRAALHRHLGAVYRSLGRPEEAARHEAQAGGAADKR